MMKPMLLFEGEPELVLARLLAFGGVIVLLLIGVGAYLTLG